MATWSSRRKSIIAYSFLSLFALVAVGAYFLIFHKTPTCFDGVKNGTERGIDCGGSCQRLCQSSFIPPKISWGGAKFEKVANGFYNVGALVANPNTNVAAVNVPYKFALYDNRGVLILEKHGRAFIPAHRNILVFDTAINTGQRIPARATFEFTGAPEWFRSQDTIEALSIGNKKYTEDDKASALEVTLENRGVVPLRDIIVGVVLYDIDGNTIGFSQTIIDEIREGSQQIAPFTWPAARKGAVATIEALPVVVPVRY